MTDTIFALDLAAKMSAYVVIKETQVLCQGDSWGEGLKSSADFVVELYDVYTKYCPDIFLIEDLPHHIRFMPTTKDAVRMQGRIQQQFSFTTEDRLLWIPPVLWKKEFKINGKGTATLIEPKALDLFGYVAPIDYTMYHYQQRSAARKICSDYAAAFLLAKWGQSMKEKFGYYAVETTQKNK